MSGTLGVVVPAYRAPPNLSRYLGELATALDPDVIRIEYDDPDSSSELSLLTVLPR